VVFYVNHGLGAAAGEEGRKKLKSLLEETLELSDEFTRAFTLLL